MTPRGDQVTIHLASNPTFAPGQKWSYESVLCRIHGGYWCMGHGTVTVSEVIRLKLDEPRLSD